MANRPSYAPRTSSRFAPGVYFNVEFGVSLTTSHERPPVRAGVQYASRHMQERIYRQQHPSHNQHSSHHQSHHERNPPPPPTTNYDQTRDYQQERQRRLGVRTLEQHERSSSAPPTVDRDDLVSPLTPEESFRAVQHTGSFPRETLDRPLPYSPARFRLGEDDLPWSVPPWYRSPEPEYASPTISRKPLTQRSLQRGTSVSSIASMAGGLPSIGFERMERPREREPRSSNSNRGRESNRRMEDPQRVRDLGELQQAMMTVDSLHQDPWSHDDESAVGAGANSLGWAVRTEPDLDFAFAGGFHGGYDGGGMGYSSSGPADGGNLMVPPPAYVDSQWEEIGRRMEAGGYRPRSSGY